MLTDIEKAFEILRVLPKRFTPTSLLAVGKLIDSFKELNYSKRRTNTVRSLEEFFVQKHLKGFTVTFPRND